MIDDTKPKQRRPVASVSFQDLRQLGFEIFVVEHLKEKPGGETVTAVKVVKTLKDGVNFPKAHMMELLRVFGLNTDERVWVTPKKKHRCLSQKEPVWDYRYQAFERDDKDWLSSGRCSIETILWSSRMKDMSEVGDNMARGGDETS